ncbi:MAG: hypothetical protein M3Q29_14755 [Chloroflexota bacterium]|nr:hypothetical protein [Chloroflexota bacterium]
MHVEVDTRNLGASGTALCTAGTRTLVDRRVERGGGGPGFNRGQVLYLAVGAYDQGRRRFRG